MNTTTLKTPVESVENEKLERQMRKNTSFSIHFIIKGAEKRRDLAYTRAKALQRELGVIPTLVCVK